MMGQGVMIPAAWVWAPERYRRRPPNSQAAINPLELQGRNSPSATTGLDTESAAKEMKMGMIGGLLGTVLIAVLILFILGDFKERVQAAHPTGGTFISTVQ